MFSHNPAVTFMLVVSEDSLSSVFRTSDLSPLFVRNTRGKQEMTYDSSKVKESEGRGAFVTCTLLYKGIYRAAQNHRKIVAVIFCIPFMTEKARDHNISMPTFHAKTFICSVIGDKWKCAETFVHSCYLCFFSGEVSCDGSTTLMTT